MEDDPNVRWRVICEKCGEWELDDLDTRIEAIAEGHDHFPHCPASDDEYQFRVQGYRPAVTERAKLKA